MFGEGPHSFTGRYYELDDVDPYPKPVQRPRVPPGERREHGREHDGRHRQHRAVDEGAVRAFIHARQHFLKRDAVFFDVLVYSGCSASRFPSARSD